MDNNGWEDWDEEKQQAERTAILCLIGFCLVLAVAIAWGSGWGR